MLSGPPPHNAGPSRSGQHQGSTPSIPSSAYGPGFGSRSPCGIWQVTPSHVHEGIECDPVPGPGTQARDKQGWPSVPEVLAWSAGRTPRSVTGFLPQWERSTADASPGLSATRSNTCILASLPTLLSQRSGQDGCERTQGLSLVS